MITIDTLLTITDRKSFCVPSNALMIKAKNGFTLIELAVVLVILSVLVAMAALHFSNNIAKAEQGALKTLGSQCRSAAAAQLSETSDTAQIDFTEFVVMPGVAGTAQTLIRTYPVKFRRLISAQPSLKKAS